MCGGRGNIKYPCDHVAACGLKDPKQWMSHWLCCKLFLEAFKKLADAYDLNALATSQSIEVPFAEVEGTQHGFNIPHASRWPPPTPQDFGCICISFFWGLFPKQFTVGFSLRKKGWPRYALAVSPELVRLVSAMFPPRALCSPWVRSVGASKPCPPSCPPYDRFEPCVRMCPPCVCPVSALSPGWPRTPCTASGVGRLL